jgi:hypothetical protein
LIAAEPVNEIVPFENASPVTVALPLSVRLPPNAVMASEKMESRRLYHVCFYIEVMLCRISPVSLSMALEYIL